MFQQGSTLAMRSDFTAKIFLCSLWIVCVYRAVTQSIVCDEAYTYELYLIGSPLRMFQYFEANHHFLNTLLMYLSVSMFGVSEAPMRLPALAGAALYFIAVYRISRCAFGRGWPFLLAIGLLTLNPFLLDFMVAARGYGMALALWMWALSLLLPYLQDPGGRTPRRLQTAAIALSLSVIAHLVFVVPAAVLAGMVIWLLRKESKTKAFANPSVIAYFVAPILLMAALFIVISPIATASSQRFYIGFTTLRESLRNIAGNSLLHSGPWRFSRNMIRVSDVVAFILAPGILLVGLIWGARRGSLLVLLCSASAVGSALLLLAAHFVFHVPYPVERTAIYFPPLVSLTLVGLAAGLSIKSGARLAYALAGTLLVLFAVQWNVRKFAVWYFDADTREISNRISQNVDEKRPNSVRVGCTWAFHPALNFYRDKNRWTWMQLVTGAVGEPVDNTFDYYVLFGWEHPTLDKQGWKLIYTGEVSGSLLAARDSTQ
jgi:hypothetical protein